jgi:hypothetical protein
VNVLYFRCSLNPVLPSVERPMLSRPSQLPVNAGPGSGAPSILELLHVEIRLSELGNRSRIQMGEGPPS